MGAAANPLAIVCLPTYNERENLERMLRAIGEAAPGVRVLVIDDEPAVLRVVGLLLERNGFTVESADSARDALKIADRLAAELGYVDVLHRPEKQGLGPAYIAGFRQAIALGAELILEMDCDFSHDPAALPSLLAAAANAELVLGSRYVPGGSTVNWGLSRRVISSFGSLYARTVLGLRVRDLTGGFKCYHRAALEAIDLDAVASKGYAFQIETTYRVIRKGMRVAEVPIRFADRELGGSKMSRSIVLEAMWKVPQLRLAALAGRL